MHAALPLLLLSLSAGPAKLDPQGYEFVELGAFVEKTLKDHPDLAKREGGQDTATFHPMERIRFPAAWTGQKRPLTGFKAEVVQKWLAQNAPSMKGAFKQEIQVKDGDRELWVAIQDSLLPFLAKEAKPGALVGLYAVFIGSCNEELILLANEFKAL